MIIISAMGRNHVIGVGDGMPWHVPEEYQHFLDTTRDQTIIMGRRSFEIFGPTLTTKHCFVITRQTLEFENAVAVPNFESAVTLANQTQRTVFIGGGASIYEIAVQCADQMLLSYIAGDFQGDTFFPEIPDHWEVVSREDRGSYELVDYRRKA